MKRQIKFRGKSLDGEWRYGDLYHAKRLETVVCICDNENCNNIVINDTIGQFTGLYDKNGDEVYEGDIFTTPQNKWVVKGDVRAYCYDAECLTQKHLIRTLWGLCAENVNVEIIGNIHDNPELLKGGEQ